MNKLEELSPELFIYELYDAGALGMLDTDSLCECAYGWCDASRLQVRPRRGLLALMLEYPDGERCWFHVEPKMIDLINKRKAKK